jgi:hypothetical protein
MSSEEMPGEMAETAQPASEAAAVVEVPAGKAATRRMATGRSRTGKPTAGKAAAGKTAAGKAAAGEAAAGEAAAGEAIEQAAVAGHGGSNGRTDGADEPGTQRDPWFEPEERVSPEPEVGQLDGPDKTAHGKHTDAVGSEGAAGNAQAKWFLPTGRAGLLPDSITESWDEEPEQVVSRPVTASAPPWAGEEPTPAASKPPPWEYGPWPGPGGGDPAGRPGANGGTIQISGSAGAGGPGREAVADRTVSDGPVDGGPVQGSPVHGGPVAVGVAGPAGWQAPAAVVAGLVPLVVPGLVMGILGLRRAGPGSARLAYWTAIGLSVVWAIVIVLLVAGGSPAGGCAGYPAQVRAAYAKAMSDISSNAPAAVQAADLAAAASKANLAAAATAQIPVRAALFGMAGDLQQVKNDVVDRRPVSADVLAHLKSDGTTFPQSCPG